MRRGRVAGGIVALAAGLGLGAAALGQASEPPDRTVRAEPAASPTAAGEPTAATAQSPVVAPPAEGGAPPMEAAAATTPDAAVEPEPAPEPLRRPRFGAAVLQAVDKITAETLRFEVRVGESVRYKGLVLTVRACEGAAADEAISDSIANLDVVFQPLTVAGRATVGPRPVFHGWMFASSPGLHPLEQPSYDVWVIACSAASGPAARA